MIESAETVTDFLVPVFCNGKCHRENLVKQYFLQFTLCTLKKIDSFFQSEIVPSPVQYLNGVDFGFKFLVLTNIVR